MRMDRVELNKLRLYAHHGVMEQERIVGNTFEVTVHLEGDFSNAMASDNIEQGISYADIYLIVKKVMDEPVLTLEHLTHRLKSALLSRFPQASGGMISVAKLTPPFPARLESAAFTHMW